MNAVANSQRHLSSFHKIQDRKISEKNPEAIKSYSEFILGIIGRDNIERIKRSKQKIVIDPNGGTGAIAKKILESAGAEVVGVNMQYGDFKRPIEPTEDSLIYLKSIIDDNKADFAAGFDCDADRVEILLDNGKFLSGNYILALVVYEVLSSCGSAKNRIVVVNDATSNVVRDIVEKFGAKIKEVEVGETNVVQEMHQSRAIAGGEGSSGGVIIPPSKCRDGILTLMKILSIIAGKKKSLDAIIKELPKYYTLRHRAELGKSKHENIKKLLRDYYSKNGFEIKESGHINGGLKVIMDKNSFVWFRASKTESNIFRIISDSNSKDKAEKLTKEAVGVFNEANE